MKKIKGISIVFCAVVLLSTVNSFSIAGTVDEDEIQKSPIITIQSLNPNSCGFCIPRFYANDATNMDVKSPPPHSKPLLELDFEVGTACTGRESWFESDCDDDDDGGDGDGDDDNGPVFPTQSSLSTVITRENVISNSIDDCILCGQIQNDILSAEESSIEKIENDVNSLPAKESSEGSIMVGEIGNQQTVESTTGSNSGSGMFQTTADAGEPETAGPITLPAVGSCPLDLGDWSAITFYPPENVLLKYDTVNLPCGQTKKEYIFIKIYPENQNIGFKPGIHRIEVPFFAETMNSMEDPITLCPGGPLPYICGFAFIWGNPYDTSQMDRVIVDFLIDDAYNIHILGYGDGSGQQSVTLLDIPSDSATIGPPEEYDQIPMNEQVVFDASSIGDPDDTSTSYKWDFGDGATSNDRATTTHIYDESGEYSVGLIVEQNGMIIEEGYANVEVVENDQETTVDETQEETPETNSDENEESDISNEINEDSPNEPDNDENDRFEGLLELLRQLLSEFLSKILG